MKKRIFALFVTLCIALPLTALQTTAVGWDEPSLKDAFADYFYFGNIVKPWEINIEEWNEHFIHHYNFVTLENRMKPNHMARQNGQHNFAPADALVDWARSNDIQVVGHTLVWHSQSPRWFVQSAPGVPLTRAEARKNMQDYITAVATHFKGRVHTWDVVNEAFQNSVGGVSGDWRNGLRKTQGDVGSTGILWYAAYANGADESKGECGSDYIYDAYVFTRLADPGAVLYYNDFNEHNQTKREAIALMVEDLNKRWETDPRNTNKSRLLIEGIGMQAHYWTNEGMNLINNVRASIQRFAATGARVSISELDIPIGSFNNWGAHDEANFQRQANMYKGLFEVFMDYAHVIERVTIWGVRDMRSWRWEGKPLLFEDDFKPKLAFDAIMSIVPKPLILSGEVTEVSKVGLRVGSQVKIPDREEPLIITADSKFSLSVIAKGTPSKDETDAFFNKLNEYLKQP
ncbi:MAG: endo-1,4-beta-xylanase [Oscillospiraceae bacterium]|nr:endo-1,4-beta-xylanase [Oscillospiraceae bacterium]